MTVAKSLAGGLPLAAVVGRADDHGRGPHPAASAGPSAATRSPAPPRSQAIALHRDELVAARARALGAAHRRAACRRSRVRVALIGDVRGLGAMQAIELVRDRASLEPAATETQQVIAEARAGGVLLLTAGTYGNVVRFLVPLTAPDDLLDEGLVVIEEALRVAAPAKRA